MREHITRRRLLGGVGAVVVLGALGQGNQQSSSSETQGSGSRQSTPAGNQNQNANSNAEQNYKNPQTFTVEAYADGSGIISKDGSTWFDVTEYGYYYGDYEAGVNGRVTNRASRTLSNVGIGVEFISTEDVVVDDGIDIITAISPGETYKFDVPLLETNYDGQIERFRMKVSSQ